MESSGATTLTFLGAAGTVTGSKFLLGVGGRRILIDAGLYQGEKQLRERNWADFPVDPAAITDVLLTHAHLDHCGYLPRLVRDGFRGPVWCTAATATLAEIVLRDSAMLQERDAQDAAEGGWSRHQPPVPLYGVDDVEATLPLFTAVEFDRDLDLRDEITARFTRAGHILGSASVTVTTLDTSLLFSGDLGRHDHPVLRPRDVPPGARHVLVESTYGDREHTEPANLPHEPLADAIRRTAARGGSVLIPAFAVDRTEIVLKALTEMRQQGRIPRLPIYVNSPMATAALDVYRRATDELREDLDVGDFLRVEDLHEVRTVEESRNLTERSHGPSIIISSSGMATGGRVLHHLERMLPDRRNAVVLTGYQAVGTRGRDLAEGATQVKMHGRYLPVRAEIVRDEEFSVHADGSDLIDWLRGLQPPPDTVFCVHGEEQALAQLARRIRKELGLNAVVPGHGEVVSLLPSPRVADVTPYAAPEAAPAPSPSVGLSVTLDGAPVTAAHVEGDLAVQPGPDEDTVVLAGTITLRLTRRPRP